MAAGAGVSRIERALVFDITGPGISNCLQWPHGPPIDQKQVVVVPFLVQKQATATGHSG